MERLHKFLARAGVASRRAAETMILAGRVKVNGEIIKTLGTKVDGDRDLIVFDGKPVTASRTRRWFIFYKPTGVVTTMRDPQGRPTISDYVNTYGNRVFPVGRLDYDAEGALLVTDDGETANKLMHPRHQVPRVYLAKVKGEPDDASLEKLRKGVRLEDGMATPKEVSRFEKADRNTWLKIVVTEGRPHLVKRLCAAIGHPVVRLYRPVHAGISVQGLKPGAYRELEPDEIRSIEAVSNGGGYELDLKLPARRHGHGVGTDDSNVVPPKPGFTVAVGEAKPKRFSELAPKSDRRPPRADRAGSSRPSDRSRRPRRQAGGGGSGGGGNRHPR